MAGCFQEFYFAWSPYNLEKKSDYYCMACTPNNGWVNKRVSAYGKYEFEMKNERSVRGKKFYRQRYYKGKWRH